MPLNWPQGRPRRDPTLRRYGRFTDHGIDISIARAVERLQRELDMLRATNLVLSTNIEARLDGLPRSDRGNPADPGVAVYFDLKGKPMCLPCDTYTQVAQNIAAIAAHVEATRKIERYGVASVQEMFTGFQALPAPGQAESQKWFRVLGFVEGTIPPKEEINARYRELAKKVAGSEAALAELNVARDQALQLARVA